MFYSKTIVIPPATQILTPHEDSIDVDPGYVKRVWVRWRYGSANLCGCQFYRPESQLWPSTLGEWFPSSVYPIEFEEQYEVTDEPLSFIIHCYNLDDTFEHSLWIGLSVLRETQFTLPSGAMIIERMV